MPGTNHFNDVEVRKVQGRMILQKRLTGASMEELAKEFNLSARTIERRVREAAREINVENAKDQISNELVPLAIAAFKQLLVEGDYNAARDVMQGLGLLPKNGPAQTETTAKVEMTLDQWREMRTRLGTNETADSEKFATFPAPGDTQVISAEIVQRDGEDVD